MHIFIKISIKEILIFLRYINYSKFCCWQVEWTEKSLNHGNVVHFNNDYLKLRHYVNNEMPFAVNLYIVS